MLIYWGRRGAMARFGLELLRAAEEQAIGDITFSVSRSNELIAEHRNLSKTLFEVDTFATGSGALVRIWSIPCLRSALARRLVETDVDWVVNLMPHVWTPFMIGAVHATGRRFATIIHDASPHPGDASGSVLALCNREALRADHVFTLSRQVRSQLITRWPQLEARTSELFPPDMPIGERPTMRSGSLPVVQERETFRLLFFGRILPYKGLPLLVEAVEILRARGINVRLTVLGDGEIRSLRSRLEAIGADLRLGWFSDRTLATALADTDAVALSHIEASQSGIASVAAAAGIPVVATPVGGIVEQIRDQIEGVVATSVDALAFADALARLVLSPDLLAAIRSRLAERGHERSMEAFLTTMRVALAKA